MFGDSDDERIPESSASDRTGFSSTHRSYPAADEPDAVTEVCAKRGWIKNEDGTFTPKRCRLNTCRVCGQLNAERRAAAIEAAEPTHEFTVTLRDRQLAHLPPEAVWQSVQRPIIHRVIKHLKQATGADMECAYSVEIASELHIHVVVRGWSLAQDQALLDIKAKINGGLADLTTKGHPRPIENLEAISRYLVKGMTADPVTHLMINGGRVAGHTRGFYRYPYVRRAEAVATAAKRAAEGRPPCTWAHPVTDYERRSNG